MSFAPFFLSFFPFLRFKFLIPEKVLFLQNFAPAWLKSCGRPWYHPCPEVTLLYKPTYIYTYTYIIYMINIFVLSAEHMYYNYLIIIESWYGRTKFRGEWKICRIQWYWVTQKLPKICNFAYPYWKGCVICSARNF